jgi:GcrA cell cycle regulator
MTAVSWPDEHIDALRLLVDDNLTCREIMIEINRQFKTDYSRNAIIGKIRRLQLVSKSGSKGAEPERPKHTRKRSPSAADKTRIAARSNLPVSYLSQPRPSWRFGCDELIDARTQAQGVPLLEVDGCRWPSGDGVAVAFTFCNCPKLKGFSYCAGHVRVSLRSADRRAA